VRPKDRAHRTDESQKDHTCGKGREDEWGRKRIKLEVDKG
jgi:hypothetical protein